MNARTLPRRYTAAEFDRMSRSEGCELIDGRLVRKTMGAEASWIQARIQRRVANFADDHRLGLVFESECSYACFPGRPGQVRKPDVSFVRYGRLEGDRLPEGSILIPPDMVVEVVSPKEKAYRLADKLADFESVRVPLIWVVYPHRRFVVVRAVGERARELTEADTLTGDPVLPGFSVRVADLFPPPAPARA